MSTSTDQAESGGTALLRKWLQAFSQKCRHFRRHNRNAIINSPSGQRLFQLIPCQLALFPGNPAGKHFKNGNRPGPDIRCQCQPVTLVNGNALLGLSDDAGLLR